MRPDHEFVELVWENGQPVLQGQTSTRSKPASPVSEFSDLSKTQINVNVVSPLKPSIAGKNDILVPVLHNMEAATLPPVNADSINEDEVVSWLHYPLDDALERDCCSDLLGEIPNTNINMLKDSLGVQRYSLPVEEAANDQVFKESSASDSKSSVPHTEGARSMANVASMTCTANTAQKPTTKAVGAHVGMLPNAGRALGSIREPHAESSAEDCTTTRLLVSEPYRNLLPCIKSKCMTTAQVALPSLTTLPPKMQPTSADRIKPLQIGGTGFRNFSLFSRPAVTTKANLQCIGNASGQSTTKLCNDFDKNGNSSEEYSLLESAASGASAIGFNICGDGQGEDSGQCTVLRSQSCCQSHQSPLLRKTSDPAKCLDTATDSNAKSAAQESCQNSNVTENVDLGATENCGDPRYVPEPLVTSSSEGSGNSAGGTGKEAANSTKRKSIYVEEFECQSEDVEDESLDAKKLVPSCVIKSKRSRAAEVHNQSERRRRDRINEKMRALQDLIPNCNKSDKASMLDEAIEYLKALQLQVQIMSGGGMGILPMALPVGMRHLQVPHMMQLSPMGLGSGMGFGLGMHCSAFSGSAISGTGGLHVFGIPQSRFPMPGLPGSGLPMCGLSALPASGVTSSTIGASAHPGRVQPGLVPTLPPNFAVLQDQIQNASSSDYYKLCLGWQQMQVSPEAMNANMYNMLMFQQHQYLAGMSGGKTCNPSTGSGQTTSGTS